MAIKSGTLRRKLNESIEKHIICKVQVLLMLSYINNLDKSDNEMSKYKELLEKILITKEKVSVDSIKDMVSQITQDYIPSENQANKFFNMIDGKNCKYKSDYIKDSLLKCVKNTEAKGMNGNKRKKYKRLNAQELKAYIYKYRKIEFVLKKIGCHDIRHISNSVDDDYFICCNKNGDNPKAVLVYDNQWLNAKNYTRKMPGKDIIALVQLNMNLGFSDAVSFLHKSLDLNGTKLDDEDLSFIDEDKDVENDSDDYDSDEYEKMQRKEYESALAKDLKSYRAGREIQDISFLREGILSSISVDRFGVRVSLQGNEVLIPTRHHQTGEIVCISCRNLNYNDQTKCFGIPKYKVTKNYQKSKNIYGLYENREEIKSKGCIVLFEGEKSVMKRSTFLDNTGAALQGHSLSDAQADIIAELNLTEVIIAMDRDVDIDEIRFMCEMLLEHGCKCVSYISDRWDLLDEKDAPCDKGNETFQRLFDNRIRYGEAEHEKHLESLNQNR